MTPAVALTLTASACLLLASASTSRASIEAGEEGALALPSFDLENAMDRFENFYNIVTEIPAETDMNTAQKNTLATLLMLQFSEGTDKARNPYAVCFGYSHTITNFSNHPKLTGEWAGERLPDAMCKNAGFGPGCISTAAGAYQIIKPTWAAVAKALRLPDFSAESQDAAAVELIRQRGALEDMKAGRIEAVIRKCKNEWASLPGNYAKQGQRTVGDLVAVYQNFGGFTA